MWFLIYFKNAVLIIDGNDLLNKYLGAVSVFECYLNRNTRQTNYLAVIQLMCKKLDVLGSHNWLPALRKMSRNFLM